MQTNPADAAVGGVLDILKPWEGDRTAPLDDENIQRFLYEEYISTGGGWKRKLYYALKPVLPRPVQIALRRRYMKSQAQAAFPAWPIEPVVVNTLQAYKRRQLDGRDKFHWIGYWPKGSRFACAITHDVEWDTGLRRAPDLQRLEEEFGFCSSWNLVPERYPIDMSIVDDLRVHGGEIGIHGLHHDGRLFQSLAIYRSRMQKINAYANAWKAVGFRSPSTLRNAEWMREMTFLYDSSFPDTDPYEPQPGGCCTIWPYAIGKMLELPMTMPQDHTLFEIHQMTDISVWKKKAAWLAANGGLLLLNVHPDYMLADDRLAKYRELLHYLRTLPGMWHALPREIAQWWLDRHASRIVSYDGRMVLEGPAVERGEIMCSRLHNGELQEAPVV
jgi:hypothetical protein